VQASNDCGRQKLYILHSHARQIHPLVLTGIFIRIGVAKGFESRMQHACHLMSVCLTAAKRARVHTHTKTLTYAWNNVFFFLSKIKFWLSSKRFMKRVHHFPRRVGSSTDNTWRASRHVDGGGARKVFKACCILNKFIQI
jgi:hypothetical protein